jgi:tetratricopeptide (TPR) repeat protein
VHFGSVAPLAAAGLWLTRGRWRRLSPLYAILATATASVALFYVFGRYRYLLVPVVVLFAAAGIRDLVEAGRGRRGRELVVGAAILALAAVSVNLPLVRDTTARAVMYRNMGATLGREGMLEEALGYYRKAVRASPTYVEARLSLARGLAALGRRDEALGEYLAVLALRPDLREAEGGLSALLNEPPRRAPPVAPR